MRWPWRLIRADRLELLEEMAASAIKLSGTVARDDGQLDPDDHHLWDLHDIASQYEVYEHQRAKGFPTRPGGLPRYPTYAELCAQWRRDTVE